MIRDEEIEQRATQLGCWDTDKNQNKLIIKLVKEILEAKIKETFSVLDKALKESENSVNWVEWFIVRRYGLRSKADGLVYDFFNIPPIPENFKKRAIAWGKYIESERVYFGFLTMITGLE